MVDGSSLVTFTREAWATSRADTLPALAEDDLADLGGIDLAEVRDVYVPLVGVLHDRLTARPPSSAPFLVGVAGSVAAGKSTTARVLQDLLRRRPGHPAVDVVATDGFLYANAVLEAKGLAHRKGFPESYDTQRLAEFMAALADGAPEVSAPVYSHERYDVVPGAVLVVRRPDVVIVEGVNVLQAAGPVSAYLDLSIYVDADEEDLLRWYLARKRLPTGVATAVWRDVNGPNLVENILPTRQRATVVLHKGADHRVTEVRCATTPDTYGLGP